VTQDSRNNEDAGDFPEPGHPVPAADPVKVEQLAGRIVRGLGLDISTRVEENDRTIDVDLSGADAALLLERCGEPLDALQYLLNRILYRGQKGKKIHVDSEGFRRLREDEIVESALLTAQKVKESNKEMRLNPLNPYERRLVHLALGEVDGIESRSEGDGFLKRIVIAPAGKE